MGGKAAAILIVFRSNSVKELLRGILIKEDRTRSVHHCKFLEVEILSVQTKEIHMQRSG